MAMHLVELALGPKKAAQDDRFFGTVLFTDLVSSTELLAEIGLGKRLNLVVARRLLSLGEAQPEEKRALGAITIRGSEGLAV